MIIDLNAVRTPLPRTLDYLKCGDLFAVATEVDANCGRRHASIDIYMIIWCKDRRGYVNIRTGETRTFNGNTTVYEIDARLFVFGYKD